MIAEARTRTCIPRRGSGARGTRSAILLPFPSPRPPRTLKTAGYVGYATPAAGFLHLIARSPGRQLRGVANCIQKVSYSAWNEISALRRKDLRCLILTSPGGSRDQQPLSNAREERPWMRRRKTLQPQ